MLSASRRGDFWRIVVTEVGFVCDEVEQVAARRARGVSTVVSRTACRNMTRKPQTRVQAKLMPILFWPTCAAETVKAVREAEEVARRERRAAEVSGARLQTGDRGESRDE